MAVHPCRVLASRISITICFVLIAGSGSAQVLQPGFNQAFVDASGASRAYGVAIAEFTGDNVEDVIAGDTAGDARLLVGNGDGTFTPAGVVINNTFTDAFGLVAADFDRDGFQDVALGGASTALDGQVLLFLGNGDGTFQSPGILVGDTGTEAVVLAAADVDGDNDIDLVAGDVATSAIETADVVLFRNQLEVLGGALAFVPEVIVAGVDRGFSPLAEEPPYYPPDNTSSWEAYGLAFGDADSDGDADLMLADQAHYLYVYENDGTGSFAPIRYETIGGRPFAFVRMDSSGFSDAQAALAAGDLNSDGLVDLVASYQNTSVGTGSGDVFVWLNEGTDGMGRPIFSDGGRAGGAGSDSRGLAVGQLDPNVDLLPDIAFGNFQGEVWALFADLTDTDGDGIIDDLDNAPLDFNPPIVDMNTDGGLNRFDQLDADADGVGDPADPDDDNDGFDDGVDNCELSPNDQSDSDGDGLGDACDPRDDRDSDGDGITDGPADPTLLTRAVAAKAQWARNDTHLIIRIDALGRVFQNEFTQTLVDAATLTPEDWEVKKFDNYNGIGDGPAVPDYQVPADLPGGANTPMTVVVIPKQIWNAFGDPDPIQWINDRNANPNLELGQHGTYHFNNVPLGDWAVLPDRNFFSCETCGLSFRNVFQLLRVGRRTLLGDYMDPWIQQSGADPATSPRIDWSDAANPLLSYAPPFNASDPPSRDATAQLGYPAFSASVFEENSPIFTPEGSHQNDFDGSGMFHASAAAQIDPEDVGALGNFLTPGQLNTWLIEEVEWSTRYCNDLPRLAPCAVAPGGVNRENNMVDLDRWASWLELLDYANANGEVMTMGDYALAVATDNCPGVPNADQADGDADGTGDVCDVNRIDIKPGSELNPVNPGSRGKIPVAILGNEFLDLDSVQRDTLRFGPNQAEALRTRFRDVDGDGERDLLAYFEISETGIVRGDTEACLRGVFGMSEFEACDSITTVTPCGLGFELSLLLPGLLWLRRRRSAARVVSRG